MQCAYHVHEEYTRLSLSARLTVHITLLGCTNVRCAICVCIPGVVCGRGVKPNHHILFCYRAFHVKDSMRGGKI